MKKLRIAVVGSGISGLSAAWLLSQRHDVQLFESEMRLGGHANTVTCRAPEGEIAVDTGFIVYNETAYPNLVALFDYLDVPTVATEMGFGVSLDEGRVEYAGRGLSQVIGGARNLIDPQHWRMLLGIAQFFRSAPARAEALPEELSLGAFLTSEGYSQAFVERHLLPMAGAIWSAAPQQMLDYPARAFLRFFENHGLLRFRNRPKWRTVVGGSRVYVERLVADGRMAVSLGRPVLDVARHSTHVSLALADGEIRHFDHVVLATHADQALSLLNSPTAEEYKLLSCFSYSRNRAVLHRDPRLMPMRRRLWSSWNYLGTEGDQRCAITYWMNALQPLATATDYFVTLNPAVAPDPALVIGSYDYDHPIFDTRSTAAQRHLWDIQGQQRTWYCGAHFGAGFHEDGLQAGLAVAEALGGVVRPWSVPNASGRIHTKPSAGHAVSAHMDAAA